MTIERRFMTSELRAAQESREIVGYFATFNSMSLDLGGFREIIRPGAFTRSLKEQPDVKCFWQHDTSLVLGRTTPGTLELEEDERGLRFKLTPPNSPLGQNALESVRRGDVTSCSFGFNCVNDRVTKQEDGTVLRELFDVDLFEGSLVTYPAFPASSAEVRSDVLARITELNREQSVEPEYDPAADPDLRLRMLRLREIEAERG